MELQLDVIAVLLVFIGFCIGSALLVKKANKEMKKQELENNKLSQNDKNTKK
ncbi:hypothetical protein [Clostridium formicaceticum]|uniref:Uncharacterized protein n=1 Tax=Clostridium formicaceticum TaxID=1497 RepID=A0AAC9RHQ6_9CLOT|nr:hypothetical protein [Clostridium formicaceticum]ARE87199.1 hypothetical protein CLFO_15870 [Clostridium formicaceticum]